MDLTVENVHVTNWSQQPFLSLGRDLRGKLAVAIRYARQMVDDSCEMLGNYHRCLLVAQADLKMAEDMFVYDAGVPDALKKYFGLHMRTMGDLATVGLILTRFRQIQQGICGQFDIVVGAIHDGEDILDGLQDASASLFSDGPREAWRDIKGIRTMTNGWVRGGNVGRIHLNINAIKNRTESRIARIIVHEASHKFAGTDDVTLLSDGTHNGPGGYKAAGGLEYNTRGYVGLDNNADSFAWGARAMWRHKRKIPKTV